MKNATKSKLTTISSILDAAGTMRCVYRESRCACGCGGTWRKSVSGTIGMQPAVWMGCSRRNGSAVGGGLTGDDVFVAHAVLAACARLDIDIDDVMESEKKRDWCIDYVVGPLALDFERELLEQVVAAWNSKDDLRRLSPEDYLAKRHLAHRDIDIDEVCEGIWSSEAV